MSDHEETFEHRFDDTRYSTPVPELDDHRNNSVSMPKPGRSRRGTVDTLYGTTPNRAFAADLAQVDAGLLNVRDFEHAIIDEEGQGSSAPRERRPTMCTVGSSDSRSESPPNSVKAFAEARRRERPESIRSFRSNRSRRSRRMTNDATSIASSAKSAEDDVCYPQPKPQGKPNKLYIDYEYLEDWIAEEEANLMNAMSHCDSKAFPDLRRQATSTKHVNSDGDMVELPSSSSTVDEKNKKDEQDGLLDEKVEPRVDHNRYSFFSSAWESTINASSFGGLILPGESVRGLFRPSGDDDGDDSNGVWWMNMNNPSRDEINHICRAFGVHPLTSEDIGTQETREKIELFPSYYFACFRSFNIVEDEDGEELEPYNIYAIVFREGTLSFSFAPNAHASHVRQRITQLKDYVSLSADWICYALIDDIVDSFFPSIHQIEKETDFIEDQVFIARNDDMHAFLRQIGSVRKKVMGLMKLLGGKADVLRGFTKRCTENYSVTPRMDVGMYLGDIQDHVVTMMSNLNHYEKMLSRSHSNYLAQLQIDNILSGNRSNEVLSKITFLASILVPLNLVCGMFGMNVYVPFRDVDNLAPFFGILGFLIAFSIIALVLARRLKYI